MSKCLKCEKTLKFDPKHKYLIDGGFMDVGFHYGSRHDMRFGYKDNVRNFVTGYICDDCYEKHSDLFLKEKV